jgi:hypothetical protein
VEQEHGLKLWASGLWGAKTGALKRIEKETSISRKKLVKNAFFQEKPDIIFRVFTAFKSEKILDLRIKFG